MASPGALIYDGRLKGENFWGLCSCDVKNSEISRLHFFKSMMVSSKSSALDLNKLISSSKIVGGSVAICGLIISLCPEKPAEEYEGKSKLKVKAFGKGELQLSDDEIVFGGLRTKNGKFLCLMCILVLFESDTFEYHVLHVYIYIKYVKYILHEL